MFRRKRRTPWIKKMLIALMIGCLMLGVGTFYVVKRLRPMICPIAVAEAKSIATMSINTAVNQELSVSEIGYDDLITLEMDAENHVTALKANTMEINKLRASLTIAIQSKVDQIQDSVVEIPLGTVVNNELLSGIGPNIRIQLAPVGFVETDITNSFSAAGINQTRHQVILSVSATIAIVMPAATEYAQVETSIVLGESVLIGKVPQNYTNIGSDEDAEKWDQLINFLDLNEFYYDDTES